MLVGLGRSPVSVLSHKFAYKMLLRLPGFGQRSWSTRRSGVLVIGFHETLQSRLQFSGAAMGAAAQLPLRQGGEPTLDQIDPGLPGGSIVQMITRMAHQPALNQGGLVRAIVIQNQMHIHFRVRKRGDACGVPGGFRIAGCSPHHPPAGTGWRSVPTRHRNRSAASNTRISPEPALRRPRFRKSASRPRPASALTLVRAG